MGIFSINWRLLPPKAHYFLYFGGMASFWPFITVFAKQLGVTEVPVGILFTLAPVTGLISMPLFGAVADRFKLKKKLFLLFNLINFLAVISFAFLPTSEPHRNVSLDCDEGMAYVAQNRSDFLDSSSLESKCNVSDVIFAKDLEHPFDTCDLTCKVTGIERKEFCSSLFETVREQVDFCGSEEDGQLHFLVEVRTSAAFILKDVLRFPLGRIHEDGKREGERLSCLNKATFSNCDIDCKANPVLDFRLQKIPEQKDIYVSSVFWSYAFLVLVTWITFAVVTSVADALCFQTLGDKPHLYGVQRQWGAMGWGAFSLLAGVLVDHFSQGSLIKDYSPCFYLIIVMLGLNFVVCWRWEVKEEEKPRALGNSMVELVTTPKIAIFISACIVVGICTGLMWQFLFWYAEDIASCEQMEYIKRLQGLISIIQCFGGELPFFYVSSWFIKKLGHVHCMTLVLFAFSVRFLIYSFLTNPWHILPVELLQGVTYGIFYSNMASYAYVVSPPGSAATVQGIVGAAFEGIGVGVGSLFGGVLYNSISGRLTFRAYGAFTLCFCILHHVLMRVVNKRFDPLSQNETEGFRNGHNKLEEMKEMQGSQFPGVNYESD